MAEMAVLVSGKVWFLFIALTVEVVVSFPATDLLKSVDCLLRDCERYVGNADKTWHFSVTGLVAWPLNESEAGVDLFLRKFLLIGTTSASLR